MSADDRTERSDRADADGSANLDGDTDVGPDADAVSVEHLRSRLEDLEGAVDDPAEREEVRHAIGLVDRLHVGAVGGDLIRKFTTRDVAEAFVGSIVISLPMLVEDGVFDVADALLATPVLFVGNAAFVCTVITGLLYYADFREVQVYRPLFGIVPRRLLAMLLVALVTATVTMTLWGRVGDWADPGVALARIFVVWQVAVFGAALGDILPGESAGDDINDELDDLGERLGIGDEEGRF